MTQLSSTTKHLFRTDRFISRYAQVEGLAKSITTDFLTRPKSHRVYMNLVDTLNTNNIGGFNISNFKLRYLHEFITEVISDYEQSLIGQVIKNLQGENSNKDRELWMSITKFKGEVGYSLLQGNTQDDMMIEEQQNEENSPRAAEEGVKRSAD